MAVETLAIASPTTHHAHDPHDSHVSPLSRLFRMLGENRSDLFALLVYTLVTGLLALILPVAAQSLVNTISQRIFRLNLVVLTSLVLAGALAVGVLRLMQLSLVEMLQQRVFARVALDLAQRLPRIRNAALAGEYAPELVNRFFDVLTIQKTLSKLLLDGLGAAFQASIGLILLAFYSTILLGFDLLIIGFVLFVFFVLGIGGLRTSIQESVQKYRVAEWLEEIARCQTSLKMDGTPGYLLHRADSLVVSYLQARRAHFRVNFRQAAGSYLFQALASAGTLGIGGFLVMNGQLTLGQLVAAELIIVSVLSSLEKLIKQTEQFYDLLTGLEKVGHLIELPTERLGGHALPATQGGVSIHCRSVRFSYLPGTEVLSGLNLSLQPGERVSLVGASGAGKSTLANLLCGLDVPSHGTVEVGGIDVRDADLESLRGIAALVGDTNEIIEGSIEENVRLGRENVSHEDIRWALEVAQFTDDLAKLPHGVQTHLVSAGRNLSRGQIQRLLLARAIADRPQMLILDEAFTGIDERTKLKILDTLYAPENRWTIIDISHDAEVVLRSGAVHVLAEGRIVETETVENLAARSQSAFASLFPDLCRQISVKQEQK